MYERKYLEKAKNLDISATFIKRALEHKNKSIMKLVQASDNKQHLQINLEGELYNSVSSKPFDFTYLMGIEFGVLNLYRPEELSSDVKRKLILGRPNKERTQNLLENNKDAIANYLCMQYELNKDFIFTTMKEMFQVQKKNPNYENEIALDIGKMVTAYYMCFGKTTIMTSTPLVRNFFESGEAMTYFNCHNKKEQHHK